MSGPDIERPSDAKVGLVVCSLMTALCVAMNPDGRAALLALLTLAQGMLSTVILWRRGRGVFGHVTTRVLVFSPLLVSPFVYFLFRHNFLFPLGAIWFAWAGGATLPVLWRAFRRVRNGRRGI